VNGVNEARLFVSSPACTQLRNTLPLAPPHVCVHLCRRRRRRQARAEAATARTNKMMNGCSSGGDNTGEPRRVVQSITADCITSTAGANTGRVIVLGADAREFARRR
jgi:hypothetical protein